MKRFAGLRRSEGCRGLPFSPGRAPPPSTPSAQCAAISFSRGVAGRRDPGLRSPLPLFAPSVSVGKGDRGWPSSSCGSSCRSGWASLRPVSQSPSCSGSSGRGSGTASQEAPDSTRRRPRVPRSRPRNASRGHFGPLLRAKGLKRQQILHGQ